MSVAQRKIFHFSTFVETPTAPFHIARTVIEDVGDLQFHSHDYAEFFFISSGTGVHLINGQQYAIQQGSYCFIRPEDVHTFKSSLGQALVITNLALPWAAVHHYQERYYQGRSFFWQQTTAMPLMGQFSPDLLQAMIKRTDIISKQEKSPLQLDLFLLYLFSQLEVVEQGKNDPPAWLMSALKRFKKPKNMRQGQQGFISLCDRSGDHVNRLMKVHYQKTLTEMINFQRLNYIAVQLVMTNAPLKVIYTTAGYSNHSYFFRLFKKQYGLTPLEYRVKHHKVF
ncbi:AraC family transcriptional regulator [Persicobacter psychrovividus]|uniref:Transcriptional regulator n=1 Tax=Persicobacter psychrovividus TaxID=387638 RepID=A0ABM7VMB8_9BACT|nr:transcriptional regulator [Persicobacter psychrovividus]